MEGSGAIFMMQHDKIDGRRKVLAHAFVSRFLSFPVLPPTLFSHLAFVAPVSFPISLKSRPVLGAFLPACLCVRVSNADLHRMYRLFSFSPATLQVLMTAMKNLATKDGKDLVSDQERAKVGGWEARPLALPPPPPMSLPLP
jgi:hypothetical protein